MGHRLDLKVGSRCNNHCRFCVQEDIRGVYPEKSTEEIRQILEKRRKNNDEVVFTGGEVTIRKDFFSLVRYARTMGYNCIMIQSNGRMFAYEEFCKKSIEAGANCFGLALHGSTKAVHDKLTRAPGSFDQTVQGIRNLKKLNQLVLMNTVISKPNYKDLPKIAKLFSSLGVEQFQFAFIHINQKIRNSPERIEKIVPRKSAVEKYLKQGLQIGIDNNIRVMVEAVPYCFMRGYEKYLSDRFIPETSIEGVIVVDDFDKMRREQGKIKGLKCIDCAYYKVCEGPWREYPEIFGWKEFKPVKAV